VGNWETSGQSLEIVGERFVADAETLNLLWHRETSLFYEVVPVAKASKRLLISNV
jgi:hypothetical protein